MDLSNCASVGAVLPDPWANCWGISLGLSRCRWTLRLGASPHLALLVSLECLGELNQLNCLASTLFMKNSTIPHSSLFLYLKVQHI